MWTKCAKGGQINLKVGILLYKWIHTHKKINLKVGILLYKWTHTHTQSWDNED